jgi:chromosome segregation ATPase
MLISRIVSLFAGALLSAVILRKKDTGPSRSDLEEVQKKFTEDLAQHDSRLQGLRQELETMATSATVSPDAAVLDLTARLAELQPKIEAMARQLAQKPDADMGELAARISQLQPKIEAVAAELAPKFDRRINELAVQVDTLRQIVSGQDQKLQATNKVVVAIEQLLTSKMAEFDQRLEMQGRTLQAMNSSIAQSDGLLERVLDLVQAAPQSAGEPR